MTTVATAGVSDRPATATDSAVALRRRRHGMVRALAAFVVIVGLSEAAVRIAAPNLPTVQRWSSQEEQAKVDQMHKLARAGQVGGVVFVGSSMMDAGLDATAYQQAFGGKVPVYNASL
ncbi:MAG TPA: hypothetical protein VNY84_05465, partial [Acidimicrobiales bacterium]|nr:hypothetical protein [Acidimicrobiales bacterium]